MGWHASEAKRDQSERKPEGGKGPLRTEAPGENKASEIEKLRVRTEAAKDRGGELVIGRVGGERSRAEEAAIAVLGKGGTGTSGKVLSETLKS